MIRIQTGTHPSTKSLKRCVLSSLKDRRAKALIGAIRHFESGDWHSKSAEWHSWMPIALSCLGAFWTPFLGFLKPRLGLRRVFNPYSKIFNYFLDNSNLFSNNHLVDKYSKINLDKV